MRPLLALLLLVSMAASARAADVKVDDIAKISYRIDVPGRPAMERTFMEVNPDFQASRVGTPIDAGSNLQINTQSQAFQAMVARTRADVDGNRFLSPAEVTRHVIIVLGYRAVPPEADAGGVAIQLLLNGRPVGDGISLANRPQAVGLARYIGQIPTGAGPIGGALVDIAKAIEGSTVDSSRDGGGY